MRRLRLQKPGLANLNDVTQFLLTLDAVAAEASLAEQDLSIDDIILPPEKIADSEKKYFKPFSKSTLDRFTSSGQGGSHVKNTLYLFMKMKYPSYFNRSGTNEDMIAKEPFAYGLNSIFNPLTPFTKNINKDVIGTYQLYRPHYLAGQDDQVLAGRLALGTTTVEGESLGSFDAQLFHHHLYSGDRYDDLKGKFLVTGKRIIIQLGDENQRQFTLHTDFRNAAVRPPLLSGLMITDAGFDEPISSWPFAAMRLADGVDAVIRELPRAEVDHPIVQAWGNHTSLWSPRPKRD
jgi:hypothetical protein